MDRKLWKELMLRAAAAKSERGADEMKAQTAQAEKRFYMESCNTLLIVIGPGSVLAGSVSERFGISQVTTIHTYN